MCVLHWKVTRGNVIVCRCLKSVSRWTACSTTRVLNSRNHKMFQYTWQRILCVSDLRLFRCTWETQVLNSNLNLLNYCLTSLINDWWMVWIKRKSCLTFHIKSIIVPGVWGPKCKGRNWGRTVANKSLNNVLIQRQPRSKTETSRQSRPGSRKIQRSSQLSSRSVGAYGGICVGERGVYYTSYRGPIQHFVEWCQLNYLQINAGKRKELVMDFCRPTQ